MHMKKVLPLTFASLCITFVSYGQIAKGKTLLGGSLGYGQSEAHASNITFLPGKLRYVTLNPSVGIAFKENTVLGVDLSLYTYNQKTAGATPTDIYVTKSRVYGSNVFVRRYVPLLNRFYFYAQASVGGGKSEAWTEYNNQKPSRTDGWSAGLSLNPGLTYAVTKKLYVESGLNGFALLAYSRSKTKDTDSNTGVVSTTKGSNFNFSTTLGGGNGLSFGFRLLL